MERSCKGNLNIYDKNAYLGNWKHLKIKELRLKPDYTLNKGFFSCLSYIIEILPYLKEKYYDKGIFLNIQYYSHNYGSYPNFEVIGNDLKLAYGQTLNKNTGNNKTFVEIHGSHKKLCGKGVKNIDNSLYYSFKDNYKLANEYFYKYFKFGDKVTNRVKGFIYHFYNKKILGIHYRGSDKNRVPWVSHITIDEFLLVVDYELKRKKYDKIFLATDEEKVIDIVKQRYNKYEVLTYSQNNFGIVSTSIKKNQSIHLNHYDKVCENIKLIKKEDNHEKKSILELKLKSLIIKNGEILQEAIITSIILSKCDFVLKTHSQLSAYAKVFNPELEIYRVNGSQCCYWPESFIPLYKEIDITDKKVKKLILNKAKMELPKEKKMKLKMWCTLP